MTRRVLVTRPQPGADATAARLARMGFWPVVLPLSEIVAVEPVLPRHAAAYDAVVATSANALRHAPRALLDALSGKPLYAVGDATAEAARAAGFAEVRSAAGTAIDLAAMITASCAPGARLLHLAGTERTAGFDEAMGAAGFVFDIAEIYRADKASHSTDLVISILGNAPIWGATVFSERGGMFLAEFAARPPLRQLFETTRFFCISPKAAAPLRRVGRGRILVSAGPDEDGVLALLSP